MSRGSSPTVRRKRLGAELRQRRDQSGLTIEHVAEELELSASTVSRMETGRVPIKQRDLKFLLALYETHDDKVYKSLLELGRQARKKGWWHSYSDVLPNPHATYIGLEVEASAIETYQSQLVPGLLQTEDYTRAIAKATRMTLDEAEIDRAVRVRETRQELLTRQDPLHLWVVLNEEAIRRRIGGRDVMRVQLNHLLEMAELPNVTFQVLPDAVGEHAGLEGSFTVMSFPEQDDPDVVFLDNLTGGIYVERETDIERYKLAVNRVRATALNFTDSVGLLNTTAKEM